MTSGEFARVAPDFIYVIRDERQRRDLEGIEELAASIAKIGLLHPPIIERDGKLRVGERRWTAIKQLGWATMPIQWVDELSEAEFQLLELEENLRRIDLPWQDQCLAIHRYHQLRMDDDKAWTQTKTAEALGSSSSKVSDQLSVAKEILAGNTRVADAPKYSTARGVVERVQARKAASAKLNIATAIAEPGAAPAPTVKEPPLLLDNFHEWAAAYTDQPFNFLHCDFPYGVNADKHDQGQAAAQGGYADGFEVYTALLDTLEDSMSNVVADSAHLMFWFSMDYYAYTKARLEGMDWRVNPFPLVWFKSDNTGILPDPKRGPRRIYETAFMASRGDRLLTQRGAAANAVAWPGKDKEIHMSEKPVGMLKHFMGMIVDEYSFVLDPTCGSANALKAASALGAGKVLGLEANPEFFNRAKEAYFDDN